MFKKIFISALLVGVIAVLVVGAINRTQAKAGNETGFWQEGEARIAQGANQGRGAGNASQGLDISTTGTRGQGQGRGAGYWNTDQELPATGVWGEGQAQISELVEFTGQVSSLDNAALVVTTASGEIVEIADRAWMYAQEQGFMPQVGDDLTLTGFYETGDRLEVTHIENLTSGSGLVLRDENGRPMWAGRGRRGS